MTLEDLGYHLEFENYRKVQNLESLEVARVVSEHKDRFVVRTAEREYDGELIGNLRFSAQNRADFPAVGDWVAISEYDENKVLIHSVFPRKSMIERLAVGKQGEKQIIATNIDFACIVQAVDRDFNINRIERYLTICHTAHVKPIVIINKTDLVNDTELAGVVNAVEKRIKNVPVIAISNESPDGIERLKEIIEKTKTYCLLGSSGVGKSTLLNNLLGKHLMKTAAISESSKRGKHVTSHRELHVLESGGIIIDNPGMREVGMTDSTGGLEITFDTITELAKNCKFKDCTHTTEIACAVIAAVESGEIDKSSYENYLKMEREKEHFMSTVAEKRQKDRDFGKMIKNYKKNK
ncbi:MAG: ribosome small subunit-dependent GTPase A [Cyclobacteriaceae bacterium]|nr:ribosome small subunit-dependent GTPase A [Cyclobacteriaceae bacterium]